MITNADIIKLKKVFATKEDLVAMEKRQDEKFATKDDLTKFATKDDLKGYANKEDIIKFKDAILKEIRDMRDEVALVIGYKDQIEDHEDRIDVLEKVVKISPSL